MSSNLFFFKFSFSSLTFTLSKNSKISFLASAKIDSDCSKFSSLLIFEFFDNVKVNEENETLRKNRLELINMLCKTFQNFINFQLLKTNNE